MTDLKIVAVQIEKMILTIEWTAPGDDLDVGTGSYLFLSNNYNILLNLSTTCVYFLCLATSYQIMYATMFEYLMDDKLTFPAQFKSQDVISGTLKPLISGSKQTISLSMSKLFYPPNSTYFIALRTIDKANQTSKTSNIVSIQVSAIETPQTMPPPTTFLSKGFVVSSIQSSHKSCNSILYVLISLIYCLR